MTAPIVGTNVSCNIEGAKHNAQIRAVNKDGTVDVALFEIGGETGSDRLISGGASGLVEATDPKDYGTPNRWWR